MEVLDKIRLKNNRFPKICVLWSSIIHFNNEHVIRQYNTTVIRRDMCLYCAFYGIVVSVNVENDRTQCVWKYVIIISNVNLRRAARGVQYWRLMDTVYYTIRLKSHYNQNDNRRVTLVCIRWSEVRTRTNRPTGRHNDLSLVCVMIWIYMFIFGRTSARETYKAPRATRAMVREIRPDHARRYVFRENLNFF